MKTAPCRRASQGASGHLTGNGTDGCAHGVELRHLL